MGEIKIIVDDGEHKFHGKNKLYLGYKEDTAVFFLNHPDLGRIRCYVDKDNVITARKRPFRKGNLFILGKMEYEYGRPTAMITQNLNEVYPPSK